VIVDLASRDKKGAKYCSLARFQIDDHSQDPFGLRLQRQCMGIVAGIALKLLQAIL
jgi:hypothetical protein